MVLFLGLAAGCGAAASGVGEDVEGLDVREMLEAETFDVTMEAVERCELLPFTVMTFNGGTTDSINHDLDEQSGEGDGYSNLLAEINASQFSNNLAWKPAEEALAAFIELKKPAIVGFQEIFVEDWCADVEVDLELPFVCRDWVQGDAYQVQRLLGADYQIACAIGHPDNCVGVRKDFGFIQGCAGDFCLEGIYGLAPPSGCTSGARVGTIHVELCDGKVLSVVDVHAVSSLTEANMACRTEHFRQIFEDRGDGVPAADGFLNLVFGDMNMDPFLFIPDDPSAVYWNEWVGGDKPFHYLSSDSALGTATHVTTMRLDHVVSDRLEGSCVVAGMTEGVPPVMETSYFDHRPVVCEVVGLRL